jgi:pyridoxamine 5'-phosphate oxidase
VKPEQFEFWQGRPNRLHDRFRYLRREEGWQIDRLAP